MDQRRGPLQPSGGGAEPIFNMPGVVVALIALLVGLHVARLLLLTPEQDTTLLLTFAFFPERYGPGIGALPGGVGAAIWSPFTYGLLHGGTMHLVINAFWMAAFGSAVARVLGTGRFVAFTLLATAAGAFLHLAVHGQSGLPIIGASAAISGHMAAAARFMFAPRTRGAPALMSLRDLLASRRALGFLGVWFAVNLFAGLAPALLGAEGAIIAWEAHVGGFLFGLFAFPAFVYRR